MHQAFPRAGYQAFSGGIPEDAEHAALAIDYAHVTAPLRRLVDRYAGEICVALCAGHPVPVSVLRALDALPDGDGRADRRAKKDSGGYRPEGGLPARAGSGKVTGTVIDVDRDRQRGVVMI